MTAETWSSTLAELGGCAMFLAAVVLVSLIATWLDRLKRGRGR